MDFISGFIGGMAVASAVWAFIYLNNKKKFDEYSLVANRTIAMLKSKTRT